ncbi:FRG1 family protein [Schizosaccharomyces japonicus yFS275]|uniref:FRG1 family protein n=1 Tax=Schizosaccharomyces japonicus (strain yFS275 / FY16936) TaxID=402676 RepID=B6K2C8_SCHJY|nr:FRG1 family protein [Schizosaccharomyces japonicus yFS275]EEB07309.2 FRG1 family protein [Schizosaccharomyces japonicus yFS275]
MSMRLTFKGDKKTKKRKRKTDHSSKNVGLIASESNDDVWMNALSVSELKGPIVLCIQGRPGEPWECLSSHPNNPNVHVLQMEDESHAPDKTEQVWVCRELDGNYQLKNSNGYYLSAKPDGTLVCDKTAISITEEWQPKFLEAENAWTWKNVGINSFLTLQEGDSGVTVCCIREKDQKPTKWVCRVQTRFAREKRQDTSDKHHISRQTLEAMAKRPLTSDEVKLLKKAYRNGMLHEALLDLRTASKSDKYG